MSLQRPIYRRNPPFTIGRKGRKMTDEVTGAICYERYLARQGGFLRDTRNRGSWETYYGKSANVGRSQPGTLTHQG